MNKKERDEFIMFFSLGISLGAMMMDFWNGFGLTMCLAILVYVFTSDFMNRRKEEK